MTDKTYKLVPVEPTEEMLNAAGKVDFEAWNPDRTWESRGLSHPGVLKRMRNAYEAATAAAPEPVCRWENDGLGAFCGTDFITECGNEIHNICDAFTLCPHCGKKVEVVGNE